MEDAAGTVKNKSMRKSQKKQIENMLDLLDQAHTAIKKAVETGNTEIALTLLEQAQDSAIQVGGMIEESLGEEFATVRILESYCEQVYQSYEMIRQQQAVNIGKVYKSLRRELIRMENSVKNDIPIRTSVVFLPYKASMWDSLESVWKAADADPDCDAYVIPIPYFDKNPDGSFRKMHYEGDLYPKDVPVVSWEEFDLAGEYPDIIYIHNPYDECNHVTSVHPAFYARELRKFTDKLVYIPYFILPEINPDDQVAIDGMKHFCFTPGTIYANQVIVQSEDMRQIYINEYSKAAKEMGLSGEHVDRKFLEKKFLGTGSPKIDKVLSTKKEDLEIPAEWLKVIEKPDGSWKKIVFYNTGVSALLQSEDKLLRKMESVFELFKENRDEVALLWRPHPLIQATIESMRPQLWAVYREIKDRYIAEGWGIYDDSADVNRAVTMSDAYYGVGSSSVVQLYQRTGKPMMVQDIQVLVYMSQLHIDDGVLVDGELWFYPFNKLCVADVKGEVRKYYDIPFSNSKKHFSIYSFGSVAYWNRKIYLIPYCECKVYRFDIDTEKFTTIDIKAELMGEKGELFIGSRNYSQYIFMLGARVPAIARINAEDNSIQYITDWVEEIQLMGYKEEEIFFERQSVLLGNKLFAPFYAINAVLELDCETLKTVIHKIDGGDGGYCGICCSEDSIWLLPKTQKNLIKWDVNTGETKQIDISSYCEEQKVYWGMASWKNNKFLLPKGSRALGFKNEKEHIFGLEGSYSFTHEDDNRLIIYEDISGVLSVYDKESGRIDRLEIVAEMGLLEPEKLFYGNDLVFHEQKNINVRNLIEFIK